jgi:NarL family two-component system response regulator LiaR
MSSSLASSPTVPRAIAAERLRVIIADADPLARRAVRDLLQDDPGFVVVADVSNGADAVDLALHYRPELVLMELVLPRLDGLSAMRRILSRAPQVRVVMFSLVRDPELQLRALRAGASGFVSKDVLLESVGATLQSVARGEAAVSPALAMRLIERLRHVPEVGTGMRPVKSNLTAREWEVLDLLIAGVSTADLAKRLFLVEDTVYSHIKSIMRKLDVHTRAEAISVAARLSAVGDAPLVAASGR